MSFERDGFKPEKGDQAALIGRAVSEFTPRESKNPLVKEARAAENEVSGEKNERKLIRGKVSSNSNQRHKDRYGIKSREEEEEEEEESIEDESEEALNDMDLEDEEFEDEETEDEEFEEEEKSDLDLSNPTVRLLVEQNQRLMQMIEVREQESVEQQQEEATLALGNVGDLFTEEDITAAQDDPKKLLELFTKAIEHMGTRILQSVPVLVNRSYSRKSSMAHTVENFFSENPQLENSREFVGHLARKVAKEQPNVSAAEVLAEAGRIAYKELGIKSNRKKRVVSGRKEKGLKKGRRQQNAAFARTPRGKSQSQPKRDVRNNDQKLIDRIVKSANVDNR